MSSRNCIVRRPPKLSHGGVVLTLGIHVPSLGINFILLALSHQHLSKFPGDIPGADILFQVGLGLSSDRG